MAEYIDFFNEYVMGSVQMVTGFYFFIKFLKKKIKPVFYLLFAVVSVASITVIRGGRIAEFLAYVLLLAACGIFGCREEKGSVVLYAVLIVEIMQFCYGIADGVLCILYPMMTSFDQKFVGTAFMVLGNMALVAAVFCYRMMYKYFLYDETVKSQYIVMILIPALMIFLIGEYINSGFYGNIVTTGERAHPVHTDHYQMLVIQLLGMASLFCMMFVYKKLLENFRLSTEISRLEQEEHSLNQYVEEAKARYDKTKSFRHDIRNHMTVVRDLLQNGKMELALNYMKDMEGMAEELSFPCSTNNPTVDILLANKFGIAEGMGINTSCSVALPYPCAVRDIDFCIVLSNTLDNAIQACKRMDPGAEKYICVTGRIQGDFILLEVENSYEGTGVFREGTGMSNVRAVANKYHGAMSAKVQSGVFVVSVLLIIPRHPESVSRQIG